MRQWPSNIFQKSFSAPSELGWAFSIMHWNLNLCFPLVIPSGPRDSLRDLAKSPGSDSGATWVDLLQLPACRDWGWLCSHLASLGQLCSLLVTSEQLPRSPWALLSSPFCLAYGMACSCLPDASQKRKRDTLFEVMIMSPSVSKSKALPGKPQYNRM